MSRTSFFFQAEDGIRDIGVTGVQTCALPIFKAMSKNPANRYQSAADMRADLLRAVAGQRVEATPVMSDAEKTTIIGATPAGYGYADHWDDDQAARKRKDRKSTRLNSSHANISYAVFCLKK